MSRTVNEHFHIPRRDAGIPKTSWWIGPRTRLGFDRLARHYANRMSESRFGRSEVLVLARDSRGQAKEIA